jgi:hypothetical protein
MNIIELIVGDWSGDGHEETSSILFDVTGASRSSLDAYHNQGCEILGSKLSRQCQEYGDDAFSFDFISRLKAHNIPTLDPSEFLTPLAFAETYMQIAKLACPDLSWEYIEFENLNIGGYGLFSC